MKKTSIWISFLLISLISYSQHTEKLDYCHCVDQIDSITPVLEGKFERKCNDKIIETGLFIDGEMDGEWITYTPKGKIIRKINYIKGKLHGNSQFFYASGKLKLTASFIDGKKDGSWKYYTEKGKVYIDGEYSKDKPINIWTIKDLKGSQILVQYDFSKSTYLKNEPLAYHKNWDVVQNDNTGWFGILLYPDRIEGKGNAPLGGYYFANDLIVELMQVPIDFWDTYTSLKYKIEYKVASDNSYTVSSTEIEKHMEDNNPSFPYILKTNDADKLKKVEHSKLSKKLLAMKINETLNFMPPWIFSEQNVVEVYLPFVLNQIENIDKVFDK
jgi:hypothetical protein